MNDTKPKPFQPLTTLPIRHPDECAKQMVNYIYQKPDKNTGHIELPDIKIELPKGRCVVPDDDDNDDDEPNRCDDGRYLYD